MKEELKTRLDTLISIHNRMYDQAISMEIDILLLDQDLKDPSITQEAIAYTDSLIAKKVQLMNRSQEYVKVTDQLIEEELNKKAVSKDN